MVKGVKESGINVRLIVFDDFYIDPGMTEYVVNLLTGSKLLNELPQHVRNKMCTRYLQHP